MPTIKKYATICRKKYGGKVDLIERRQKLESLGVHDLRNIGRMWGIPSPTIIKKAQLIESILQVMSGEKSFNNRNRAGRPVKNKLMSKGFKESLLPNDLINFADNRNKNEFFVDRFFAFEQNIETEISDALESKEGYLNTHNKDFFFCCFDDDSLTYVPDVLVAQYALEVGDKIKAHCSKIKAKPYYIARQICLINDICAKNCLRNLGSMKDIVLPENLVAIDNIVEGEKYHSFYKNHIEFITEKQNTINKFIEKGFKIVVIGVGLPADGLLKIKKYIDCIPFVSFFEFEPLYSYETLTNAVNHITIRARMGEKLLVLALDVENIFTELDLYFMAKGEQRDVHTYSTITLLRKLTGINRCLSNGGSITLFTTTSDEKYRQMV